MKDTRLIRSIRLENILSYGPETTELELEPLNVLIGANASGKSNLIEALSLLAAAPRNLQIPIREGGGVHDWLWKGAESSPVAKIDVTVSYPEGPTHLRYRLAFTKANGRFSLIDESIENEQSKRKNTKPFSYYAYQTGHPVISYKSNSTENGDRRKQRNLHPEDISLEQSILSQRKDSDSFPELTYLSNRFEQMRFYRGWNLGPYSPPRLPEKTDLPGNLLLENASNLALVLNNLQNHPSVKQEIVKRLRSLYQGAIDFTTTIQGGTVQIFLHEKGLKEPVPAWRLSDGLLHYLCLLAVLLNPEPTSLLCLEEPEIGLQPDLLHTVGEMLVEASQRTQVIVTTHSDILINALSENPQMVVVCERDEYGTSLQRLKADQLDEWLDRYCLGELWRIGEIGGNPQ